MGDEPLRATVCPYGALNVCSSGCFREPSGCSVFRALAGTGHDLEARNDGVPEDLDNHVSHRIYVSSLDYNL